MNGQSMRQGDRSLSKYEKALKQMAKKGQIDLPMDDKLADVILNNIEPIELTNNEIRKLSLGLRKYTKIKQ
jgi:DNA-binding TFAR19-related protein (PDSD5 family)